MRVAILALFLVPILVPAALAEGCNPYPLDRCGAFSREAVVFCWDPATWAEQHRYVSATDADAVSVGTSSLPWLPILVPDAAAGLLAANRDVVYLRTAPAERFMADPLRADLPLRTAWQESNHVPGLQRAAASCGTFAWFPECGGGQWMGPIGVFRVAPDTLLA